jgi:hypothetical protein
MDVSLSVRVLAGVMSSSFEVVTAIAFVLA